MANRFTARMRRVLAEHNAAVAHANVTQRDLEAEQRALAEEIARYEAEAEAMLEELAKRRRRHTAAGTF